MFMAARYIVEQFYNKIKKTSTQLFFHHKIPNAKLSQARSGANFTFGGVKDHEPMPGYIAVHFEW